MRRISQIIYFVLFLCQSGLWAQVPSWSYFADSISTYSSPHSHDINSDGVLDIIIGGGKDGFDSNSGIMAINGSNGQLLWKVPTRNEVFGSAVFQDITNDGIKDVFITGREAQFYAIDGSDGSVLWDFYPYGTDPADSGWYNFYTPQFISDVDGDTLTASLISDVEEGTLEFNSNGSFSYTPPEGFLGEAIFTYSITDQTFETSAITATIVVTARPVAKDIEYSVFEDSILSVSSVDGYLSNDTDEDNVEDLFGQLVSPPTNGEFAFLEDGSFQYIPSENYNGNDSFTYVVSDGILTSDDTATVSILIVPVNDAPNGASDSYSVDEGGTLTVSADEGLLVNDDDIDFYPEKQL